MINKNVCNFEQQAEQMFPHILEYSLNDIIKHRTEIKNPMKECCDRLFVDQCQIVVVPDIETTIVEAMKRELGNEMDRLPVIEIRRLNLTNLSARYETLANSRFCTLLNEIHNGMSSRTDVNEFVVPLRKKISDEVKRIELIKKLEYERYVETEARKKAEEENLQRQEQQQQISEEYRRLEAERQARLHHQQEEEERMRRERETAEAARIADEQKLLELQTSSVQKQNGSDSKKKLLDGFTKTCGDIGR
jgi:hypothetical protein